MKWRRSKKKGKRKSKKGSARPPRAPPCWPALFRVVRPYSQFGGAATYQAMTNINANLIRRLGQHTKLLP
eukprot:9499499-Pyramimonas_sp.AAC.1